MHRGVKDGAGGRQWGDGRLVELPGPQGPGAGGRWEVETVPGKPGTVQEKKDGRVRGLPGGWARHIITGEKLGQSLALSASV